MAIPVQVKLSSSSLARLEAWQLLAKSVIHSMQFCHSAASDITDGRGLGLAAMKGIMSLRTLSLYR